MVSRGLYSYRRIRVITVIKILWTHEEQAKFPASTLFHFIRVPTRDISCFCTQINTEYDFLWIILLLTNDNRWRANFVCCPVSGVIQRIHSYVWDTFLIRIKEIILKYALAAQCCQHCASIGLDKVSTRLLVNYCRPIVSCKVIIFQSRKLPILLKFLCHRFLEPLRENLNV